MNKATSPLRHRQLKWSLENPLFKNHMSFIIGPRQCGKTTMAIDYLKSLQLSTKDYYFNWDRFDIRKKFQAIDWISTLKDERMRPVLVFDEIHKARNWKRVLKGIYDQYRLDFQFVVTGSGRLDHYQKGGDSLAGRFDPYFLGPFTPGEIEKTKVHEALSLENLLATHPIKEDTLHAWENLSGFPEPFLSGSENKIKAWWRQYKTRVTEEDMRDLTKLESIDLMRQILDILPAKISSPLSIESLRKDVDTSFATVKRYILSLIQLFMIFDVSPYSRKIHRAVKKEKKIYFYFHPATPQTGPRFENMVALILKRWVCEQNEKAIGEFELTYLKDQDRREVDFLIVKDKQPYFLFEAKHGETKVSSSLVYYSEKLKIPGIQIVRERGYSVLKSKNMGILSIHSLSAALG
jgi:predicted AAA+ superfamily ATPase